MDKPWIKSVSVEIEFTLSVLLPTEAAIDNMFEMVSFHMEMAAFFIFFTQWIQHEVNLLADVSLPIRYPQPFIEKFSSFER